METSVLDELLSAPLSEEEVAECNREQIEEMERHKYFESIKANKDVGKAAYADWIARYAKKWREEWLHRRAQRMNNLTRHSGK